MGLVFNSKIWIFEGIYDSDSETYLNDGSNRNQISSSISWSKRFRSGIVTDQIKIWLIGGSLLKFILIAKFGS